MKRQPRLLVIQHDLDDGLNELAPPLVAAGLRIDTWDTWLAAEPPEPLTEFDAVLSLGGLASAYQEPAVPWMIAERSLLAEALHLDMPILGVCLGSQILASVAGGSNSRAPRPEIGWCTVDVEPAAQHDRLLGEFPAQFQAMQYHHDTFTLPPEAVVLARNAELIQAFRIGAYAWGLQFHIEANTSVVYSWLGTYRADMDEAGIDIEELRRVTADYADDYRRLTRTAATAFAQVILDRV